MFTGEHASKFHLPDATIEVRQQLLDFSQSLLVFTLFPKFNQDQQIIQFLLGRTPVLYDLLQAGPFFQGLLRLVALVPEVGTGNFRLKFGYTLALVVDVKGTSSARRAFPAKIQDVIFHHGTFSTLLAEI